MGTSVRKPARLSRRGFLKGSGVLVVGFSLGGCVERPSTTAEQTIVSTPTARTPATAVAQSVAEQAPGAPPTPAPPPAAAASAPTTAPAAVVAAAPPRLSAPPAERRRGAGATNTIDSWLVIGRDERVTVFSGKVELGTGVRTALAQIVARSSTCRSSASGWRWVTPIARPTRGTRPAARRSRAPAWRSDRRAPRRG